MEVIIKDPGETYDADQDGRYHSTNWMSGFIPPEGVRGHIIKDLSGAYSKFLVRVSRKDLREHFKTKTGGRWFSDKAYRELIRTNWTYVDILIGGNGFEPVNKELLESELFEI